MALEGYSVRLACEHDVGALLALERELIEFERDRFDPDTLKDGSIHYYDVRKLVADTSGGGPARLVVAVAESSGEVAACGYAALETSQRFRRHARHIALNFMVTGLPHRGRGLNGLVIAFALREARAAWDVRDGEQLESYMVDVYSENASALRAYAKAGFAPLMVKMLLPCHAGGVLAGSAPADGGLLALPGGRGRGRWRRAATDDIPALRALEAALVDYERQFDRTLKGGDGSGLYYDMEALVSGEDTRFVVLETESSGQLLACGYVQRRSSAPYKRRPHHGYLGFMFVADEYRGAGINRLVQARCVAEARSAWGDGLDFMLEVYAENASALRAYSKAGFSPHLVQMLGPNP